MDFSKFISVGGKFTGKIWNQWR